MNYNENWNLVENSWFYLVVMVAIISTNGDWIPVLVGDYYYGDYGNGVFG